jgi:HAMP domain-containing protein
VLVEVESGWGVDWTYVALGAVIGAAILLAALLMTRGTGRHPPRGRPLTYG